jgi:hypothetical protein
MILINALLALLWWKIFFVAVLLAFRVKTFTIHFCFVKKCWRFERNRHEQKAVIDGKPGLNVIYELYGGPISFVVVR